MLKWRLRLSLFSLRFSLNEEGRRLTGPFALLISPPLSPPFAETRIDASGATSAGAEAGSEVRPRRSRLPRRTRAGLT